MTTGALAPSVRIVALATLLSTGFAGPVRADTITIGAHGLFGVIPFGGGGQLPITAKPDFGALDRKTNEAAEKALRERLGWGNGA